MALRGSWRRLTCLKRALDFTPPEDENLWPPALRFWIHFCGAVLVWAVMVVLDPLGSYSAISGKSVSLFAQVTAPFHAFGSHLKGQSQIAVVLISPSDFQTGANSFPPNADEYAQILQQILDAHPSAIFLDIDFSELHRNEHDMPAHIVSALSQSLAYRAKPPRIVPILFGRTDIAHDTQPQIPADVRRQIAGYVCIGHAVTRVRDDVSLYPLIEGESPRPAGAGPAALDQCGPPDMLKPDATMEQHYSPAFALFDLVCAGRSCPRYRPGAYQRDLVLQWGLKPPLTAELGPTCRDFNPGFFARLGVSVNWLLHGVFQGVAPTLDQTCPYIAEIPLQALNKYPAQAAQFLQHSVVFLGINDGQDMTGTPVNRAIPKIFLHAMALDNLISYKTRYYSNPPVWQYKLLASFIWVCISLGFACAAARPPAPRDAPGWQPAIPILRRLYRRGNSFRNKTALGFSILQQIVFVPFGQLLRTLILVCGLLALNIFIFRWRYNDLLLIALLTTFHTDLSGRLAKVSASRSKQVDRSRPDQAA